VRRGGALWSAEKRGVSNVAMGGRGLRDARAMAALAARAVGCSDDEVFVASTGVIGHPLPMDKIGRGIADAAQALRPDGLADASRAIMTTDLVAKTAIARTRIDG